MNTSEAKLAVQHGVYQSVPCSECRGVGKLYRASGDKLREIRTKRLVSLRSFAKTLGVSATYISDIELGNRRATEEMVKAYLQLLK